ncbi:MAG TPA: hypothetical protein VGN32_16835, partial [Ktedonobacterales bacterium]|nr:hypothetical protein [Ktedonobacterales bacterium]
MNQGERRPGDLPDEPAGSRARADAGAPFGAPIRSGRANGGVSAGGPGAANQDDKTQALPPRLVPRPRVRPSKWVVAGLVALAALVIGVPILIYALPGSGNGNSTAPAPVTCAEQNTPCGIAQLYLAAYTA